MNFSKVTIITGHYGSGKTNISVNFALDLAKQGKKVNVIDLDIVNPYFRTADFEELFIEHGIGLTAPMYANSNLDIPALNYDLDSVIRNNDYVIIDVGGDDAGATALGRYRECLSKLKSIQMYYVVNTYRYLTKEPEEAVELMYEIEVASGLKCTGIINNSNLGTETNAEVIEKSIPYAMKICETTKLPLTSTVLSDKIKACVPEAYSAEVYVKKLWEN